MIPHCFSFSILSLGAYYQGSEGIDGLVVGLHTMGFKYPLKMFRHIQYVWNAVGWNPRAWQGGGGDLELLFPGVGECPKLVLVPIFALSAALTCWISASLSDGSETNLSGGTQSVVEGSSQLTSCVWDGGSNPSWGTCLCVSVCATSWPWGSHHHYSWQGCPGSCKNGTGSCPSSSCSMVNWMCGLMELMWRVNSSIKYEWRSVNVSSITGATLKGAACPVQGLLFKVFHGQGWCHWGNQRAHWCTLGSSYPFSAWAIHLMVAVWLTVKVPIEATGTIHAIRM